MIFMTTHCFSKPVLASQRIKVNHKTALSAQLPIANLLSGVLVMPIMKMDAVSISFNHQCVLNAIPKTHHQHKAAENAAL